MVWQIFMMWTLKNEEEMEIGIILHLLVSIVVVIVVVVVVVAV